MKIMEKAVQSKSFYFALRIVNLCKYLQTEKKGFILTKQLLRSGTSIGSNVAESEHAQSRADFSSKMNIALKEAAETDYWLRLLHEANYLSHAEFQSVYTDCKELERLLAAIVKTMKK